MNSWNLNGVASDEVAIDSRALQYGDGVFETVAVRDGTPRLWPLHVDRLARGCNRLGLSMPDPDSLYAQIASSEQSYGVAKVIVAAKGGPCGYARESAAVDVLVRVSESQPLANDVFANGIEIIECQTTLAVGSAMAGLKTLNRLEQILARNEVVAAERFEGLTRDADGRLICGTMSNLFAVKDDTINTPNLDRCGVEGVMRRHIIETLASTSMPVTIADIDSLDDAQEVFLSNSQFGVLPVCSMGESVWPVGQITREVTRILAENGVRE